MAAGLEHAFLKERTELTDSVFGPVGAERRAAGRRHHPEHAPQEYDQLLTTCAERLSARGVPLYDFPFRTSQQILNAPPAKH
ncbi:hypothetical protein F2P81_009838 [Scophthalmus maximus]|uniref:Uncharacterized protein n=1 Tax=Scophthalmus maximus TaxID=52904 RepID=A0A6A4T131_SCOMX|nr:hypothetical protein F2P81_009838 [Scophthalmus maximus]